MQAVKDSRELGAWQEIGGFLAAGSDEEVGVALALMRAYNLDAGPALTALAQGELEADGPCWTPDEVQDALEEVRQIVES